jgi:hypothetical protein
MEIHKPKPMHSVREFLTEIGTIICGILIALGLEQGLEWAHWRHQVELADKAVSEEVRYNLVDEYERIALRFCLSSRVAELRDRLLQPSGAWKAMPLDVSGPVTTGDTLASLAEHTKSYAIPRVYRAPVRPFLNGAWTAAVTSGVPLHMQPERAAFFDHVYRQLEQGFATQVLEREAATKLAPLAFDRNLNDAERTQYLSVLGELDQINAFRALVAAQLIVGADEGGLRIKASQAAERIKSFRTFPGRAACVDAFKIPLAPG